jgi:hypothetical protein
MCLQDRAAKDSSKPPCSSFAAFYLPMQLNQGSICIHSSSACAPGKAAVRYCRCLQLDSCVYPAAAAVAVVSNHINQQSRCVHSSSCTCSAYAPIKHASQPLLPPAAAVAVVSNHMSWADILIQMARYFPAFVARDGTQNLPMIGLIRWESGLPGPAGWRIGEGATWVSSVKRSVHTSVAVTHTQQQQQRVSTVATAAATVATAAVQNLPMIVLIRWGAGQG